jgi:peptidoglycan/xylan/chitin deacetylase (PgdA/CDA1 family)
VLRAVRAGRHGIVYAAPRRTRRRELALTFDDGPSDWTPAVLELLGAHDANATFFVLGAAIAGREETVRRTAAAGHELGNHAWSHADPATLSDAELRAELDRTGSVVESLVGGRPRHFRPPYAATDFRVADVARAAGFDRTVLRSIDPADWKTADSDAIAELVLAEARPGAIVCLHDGVAPGEPDGAERQPTVDALSRLVPALRERGYGLVTVAELLG